MCRFFLVWLHPGWSKTTRRLLPPTDLDCTTLPASLSTRPPPSCLSPCLPEAECGSGNGTVRAQGSACGRLTISSSRHSLLSITF
ncbi:hypothetical protein VZT92_005661 [Zoarces viviparus]|uniref:Secreted protein n=1 Tax=Zoarces viviparus TaxID=48416 RepID=A0AAW1FTS1_ZOAVI